MGSHHELSPSKYSAWMNCPCWESDPKDNSNSIAGANAHDEVDKYFKRGEEPDSKIGNWAVKKLLELSDGAEISTEVKLECDIGNYKSIYGTCDALWFDGEKYHIADLKSFSDGTKNYRPQLYGYGALLVDADDGDKIVFHILHGGIFEVETFECSRYECISIVKNIINHHNEQNKKPNLCEWCQFCKRIGECSASNNAVDVVNKNLPSFDKLSLPQKLVILDAVDKLSATIRSNAKEYAKANGGFIEADGIRYEFKPWAGKSECRDIREVAGGMKDGWIVLKHSNRDGSVSDVKCLALSNDKLLDACELSKNKLINIIKKENDENKKVTKVDIEKWVEQYFVKTEGSPHFVRTK